MPRGFNGSMPPHGTPHRYSRYFCRCDLCRAANTEATREHRARPGSREKLRATQRRRYAAYAALCKRRGVSTQRRWTTHYAAMQNEAPAYANRALIRRTKCEYKRWWLERYTLDEIHRLARGIG